MKKIILFIALIPMICSCALNKANDLRDYFISQKGNDYDDIECFYSKNGSVYIHCYNQWTYEIWVVYYDIQGNPTYHTVYFTSH